MLLKINSTIMLATGQTTSTGVVLLENAIVSMNRKSVIADIKAWTSQTRYENGLQNSYLYNQTLNKIYYNFETPIPQEDLIIVQQSQSFEIIGQNYIDYVKKGIAYLLDLTPSQIEVINLI